MRTSNKDMTEILVKAGTYLSLQDQAVTTATGNKMKTNIFDPQCENKKHRYDRESSEGWNLPVFEGSGSNHCHREF